MTRLDDRLAAADPAADLRPDPAELRSRRAALLTAAPPPRRPLAVRFAPALALAGLAVIAVVVALGAPKDEREAGAGPNDPGVVHLRTEIDWPPVAAEEEVWLALDGSSEQRLIRLADGTVLRRAYVQRRAGQERLLRNHPQIRLVRLLTDVDENLLRGRLLELRRTTVEGLPVILVAPREQRGVSAYVDAHFKRPLWLARGERRERVLDWDVLADTAANRALTVPG